MNVHILNEKINELKALSTETEKIGYFVKLADDVNHILFQFDEQLNSLEIFLENISERLGEIQIKLKTQDLLLDIHSQHFEIYDQHLETHDQHLETHDQHLESVDNIIDLQSQSLDSIGTTIDLQGQQLELLGRHLG